MREHRPDQHRPTDSRTEEATGSPGKRSLAPSIQRKADGHAGEQAQGEQAQGEQAQGEQATGAGSPLPAPVQAKMEDAFDFGFGGVRVHEGGEASSMGALAYAQGTDLHFAPGQYEPGSARGQELLGHELAHVVQQSEGRVGASQQFKGAGLNDDPALELEADAWATRAARGESVGRSGGGGGDGGGAGVVQRFTGPGAANQVGGQGGKAAASKAGGNAVLKVNVNVRKSASTQGEILETAQAGTSFQVKASTGSWFQIDHQGGPAFITALPEYVGFHAAPAAKPEAVAKPEAAKSEVAKPEATGKESGGGSSWLDLAWNAATHLVDSVASFFDDDADEHRQSEGDGGKGATTGHKLEPSATPAQAAGTDKGPDKPAVPGGSLLFKDAFEVVTSDAKLRDAAFKATGKLIAKGTTVFVVKAERTNVQIVTAPDAADKIVEADQVWTAFSNLGGTGAEVGLGNEKSDAGDKTKADELRAGLPPGRTPGASPFKWQFSGSFMPSLEGKALEGTLMGKVQRLMQWAVENDMITGDIVIGDGMRGPKTAHKMCVAWNIQYAWGSIITLDALKKLPDGRDEDGTLWYQDGWTEEQIKANAKSIRASSAIAAAGHDPGDPARAPLPINGKPGVSRHCTGRAVDVTIPWRAPGQSATDGETDVWAWEDVYKQFGLHRPLHKTLQSKPQLQENWHIEETSKKIDDDGDTDG